MTTMLTTLIDANTLAARLDDAALRVIDCSFQLTDPGAGRAAYLRGHIPGAVYADLERDLSGPVSEHTGRHPLPSRHDFEATLGMLGISNNHQVVAYDNAGGAYAARLWWLLRWMGHGAVAVLNGGLQAWLAGGRSLDPGEVIPPRVRFMPGAPLGACVDAEDILQGRVARLLDARGPERFSGAEEPIDPVAGHVSGAVNHPFTQNLDTAGRFLARDVLRERLQASLGGIAPAQTAAMCGSGVTACHLLLAMEVAGLDGAALYPGSWSEWIRDPARPVATAVGDAPAPVEI
ncbi:MAG: sulfurtransferase [Gammaproteobacteria bacterium]|nr:sulfurtransferase [Gammaproteobacteria bacterium]TVQ48766.1 MAG: sulfurtransferase [Gammaproteobacteria bacterium]